MQDRVTRAAVVGAGIAGLAAACRLARAGVEVLVLDKARRPGGRLSTRRTEGYAFDHGAQYFTCRDPDFAGLLEDWCRRGVAKRWDAPIRTLCRGSVGDERGDTARFVGVPGMSALARDLEAGLKLRCGWRVASLEGPAHARRLADDEGRELSDFDAVLVATPAPQAVPLLSDAPRIAERVGCVAMQPCIAAMVGFEEPLGLDFGGAFVSESPLRWIARNDSKPGRPQGECWVLHAGPGWSCEHVEDAPEAAIEPLVSAFAEALGRVLPPPAFATAHRWRHALTRTPLGEAFLWDERARIGVCGDWTIGGRVEGAFLSGDVLARAVLGETDGAEVTR